MWDSGEGGQTLFDVVTKFLLSSPIINKIFLFLGPRQRQRKGRCLHSFQNTLKTFSDFTASIHLQSRDKDRGRDKDRDRDRDKERSRDKDRERERDRKRDREEDDRRDGDDYRDKKIKVEGNHHRKCGRLSTFCHIELPSFLSSTPPPPPPPPPHTHIHTH